MLYSNRAVNSPVKAMLKVKGFELMLIVGSVKSELLTSEEGRKSLPGDDKGLAD